MDPSSLHRLLQHRFDDIPKPGKEEDDSRPKQQQQNFTIFIIGSPLLLIFICFQLHHNKHITIMSMIYNEMMPKKFTPLWGVSILDFIVLFNTSLQGSRSEFNLIEDYQSGGLPAGSHSTDLDPYRTLLPLRAPPRWPGVRPRIAGSTCPWTFARQTALRTT